MEEQVLLLSHSKYDFQDADTGRQITGSTLWVVPINATDEHVNGVKPVKYSLKDEASTLLAYQELPCYSLMSFDLDFSRNKVIPTGFTDFKKLILAD